ncbi:SDR family oxidoreductase [Nocardia sp. NRRL WC-3656]|uniref:SDR family oxidoreductase n=1 Tax=Nocardia sp. NRRL WC-3656 TaxID=1463824 RepID=UPI00068ED430|nr:SDR family oxidoreductase [Nocardia sp. NRRL WC-3656]
MQPMTRVLVAGATGYLGRHLVAALKQHGCWVRVLVRRPEQAETLPDVDEVFVGQVTDADTLHGIADGVDTVFSSIGITRQRDGVGYDQVDYGGNLALLRESEKAGVSRFVYISVLHGRELRDRLSLASAKERFVDELRASPVRGTVIRPTGYFSDMREFLTMAQKGRVYLIGDGSRRINPISGADLAQFCVTTVSADPAADIEIGGPDVLSHNQIAEAAFSAAGRPVRITHVPSSLTGTAGRLAGLLTPESVSGPLQFFLSVMGMDMVAATTGDDHLTEFFENENEN